MDEPVAKRGRGALDDKANQQLARGKATKLMVMSNALLLTNISKSLSATDLLDFRETCRKWNLNVIPKLMSKHSPIKLDFGLDIDEEKSVEKFIELMESSSKIPFSKFNLVNCRENLLDFGLVVGVVGQYVKKLRIHWICDKYWMTSKVRRVIFEEVPQLTDLELSFSGLGNRELTHQEQEQATQFETALTWSSNKLPNLKRFKFDYEAGEWLVEAWQLVFEVVQDASELAELRLPDPKLYKHFYRVYVSPVLRLMLDSNTTNIHKLKHLEIGNVNRSILKTLLGMARRQVNALSVETFSMSVTGEGWMIADDEGDDSDEHSEDEIDDEDSDRNRAEMMQMLKTFLGTQASTLVDLSLWLNDDGYSSSAIPITLPQMEQLCALTILNPSRVQGDDPFPDLQFDGATFESAFPRLKKLKFNIAEVSDGGEYRKVSHSELTEMYFEVNIGMATDLPTLFPSLTHLDLCLRYTDDKSLDKAEVYAKIWTLWPSLTHLKLKIELYSDAINPDKLLTGVPEGQLGALKAELDTLVGGKRPTLEELEALVSKYKTRPGISDLRRLEEFELYWGCTLGIPDKDEHMRANVLSDSALYCGLALVGPQLRNITFVNGVGDLLSAHCLEFMRTQGERGGHIFPNAVINFD